MLSIPVRRRGPIGPENLRMMNVRIIIFYCSLAFSGFGSRSLDADGMCKVNSTMAEEIYLSKSICFHVQPNNVLGIYQETVKLFSR